jgi:hypothetical protein
MLVRVVLEPGDVVNDIVLADHHLGIWLTRGSSRAIGTPVAMRSRDDA